MDPVDPVPAKGRSVLLLLSDRQPSTSHSAHPLATLSPGPTLSLLSLHNTRIKNGIEPFVGETGISPLPCRRNAGSHHHDYTAGLFILPHSTQSDQPRHDPDTTLHSIYTRIAPNAWSSSTRSYPSIAQHVTRILTSFIRPSYPHPSPFPTVDRRLSLLHGPRSVPGLALLCSATIK